ncbi:amidohydrolase [Paenibacillus sp. Marseille-Q4541]|uniref:amidohydrolase n=1 Tax=Paenibacillus sp. Marseille-Q4541 TaxID=2831522 RepID=UPI001BAE32DB|nr:amidohydrolase [Paenibacillus sp. Marseille-Q4541]
MSKSTLLGKLRTQEELFTRMAKQIWEKPELGYTESYASSLQAHLLEKEGFSLTMEVGGIPTAFIAEYGAGKPIIGILGEFDALPGLSQQVSPIYDPITVGGPGHGCGHNLLGTAGVEAIISLKQQMIEDKMQGTIRYYGCPAEELLSGKTFMARDGVFDDLDCVLTWHPGSMNAAANYSMQALTGVEFFFSGRTAHAGGAPHLGRSALDAVELMNVGANYLREHVPDGSRIHYQITNGGQAPNIVPDQASVYYFLRGADRKAVDHLFERLIKVAQGAAMMTETTVSWHIKAGCYDTLPNAVLNDLMHAQGEHTDPIEFTAEEEKFAEQLRNSIHPDVLAASSMEASILPEGTLLATPFINEKTLYGKTIGGSSDIGDVSWITPMGQITTTCAPVGVQVHTWQATASFGSSIGMKGMHYAAQIMALSAYDLLLNKDGILEQAKSEFAESTSRKGITFKAGIPEEVKPPVPEGIKNAVTIQ